MLQLTMFRKFLPTCGLIVVFFAPLGGLYEPAQQPYIVEVDVKDEPTHNLPAVPGPMHAGARLKKANLKGANLRQAMLTGADLREADAGGCRSIRCDVIGRKSESRKVGECEL